MTITFVETGYLEDPYLDPPYLTQNVVGYMGNQATFTIGGQSPTGMQVEIQIIDRVDAVGQQANFTIGDSSYPLGQQADFTVGGTPEALGQQANFQTNDVLNPVGQQANFQIDSGSAPWGMQYNQTNIAHSNCGGYLDNAYLEDGYLAKEICAQMGMQALFSTVDQRSPLGQQAEITIVDHLNALGQQASVAILTETALGQQCEIIAATAMGMQATVSLYNTNLLRVLCSFPSRGLSTATGTNAWGFDAGQGQNWTSNSIEAGDFSPFNVNTDIVEEVWRSTTDSGVNLDCDTERPQGVYLDTLAILNHNLTSSATVNFIGSNDSTFSTIGITIPLEVRSDDPNIYYIAPTLPNQGYTYWRLAIDDPSNPAGYLQIGTIIFGAASIFIGECFVDQVGFQLKDYTDSVQTEAFTNVNNSRAQKKILNMEFRSLSYLLGNFRLLRGLFRTKRTVLKCLWIPTPSATNQEYTSRFAVFAKLVQVPTEQHNHKGGDADYVSFQIELDESK